ncbi:MAG: DUF1254 domain-containing protein [Bermanella sp.]
MPTITKPRLLTLSITVAIVLTALYSAKVIKQGAQAYVFGYPLVLMELTRQAMLGETEPGIGANNLSHMRVFPDHTFRHVVRPNDDTLYSIAWFDLSKEPMVISTPASDRYYVLPFMDAWTNVFATIGTNTTGNEAGHFALVGPDWQGELPQDVKKIQSPTNMVWMIGRVQTNGKDDIKNVALFQNKIAITPTSLWSLKKANASTTIHKLVRSQNQANPKAEIDALSAHEFFNTLSQLMAQQPASQQDKTALENLEQLGVVPGNAFDMNTMNPLKAFLMGQAVKIANNKLHEAIDTQSASPKENGWMMWRDTIGQAGTNYKVRAGVAMAGLGALPISEAAYASASIDKNQETLTGSHQYKVHFPKGQTPPAKAFWSLTMYDMDGFLVETSINRYLLGDRDALSYNDDGSLDIIIQHSPPTQNELNWLPAPKDQFTLMLRIYSLGDSFYDGSWKIPAIERLN